MRVPYIPDFVLKQVIHVQYVVIQNMRKFKLFKRMAPAVIQAMMYDVDELLVMMSWLDDGADCSGGRGAFIHSIPPNYFDLSF